MHPPAEVSLSAAEVERMVAEQHPALRGPVRLIAHGWDNDLFRLGDRYAVRVPRRAVAAPLIENEQRWLPVLAARLPLATPVPIAIGQPTGDYPWRWSIVRWLPGTPGIEVPAEDRDPWAAQLADLLLALHTPAPADAPHNPVRGVPLAERDDVVSSRLAPYPDLLAVWRDATGAEPWGGAKRWVHGDLHPGNVLVDEGRLAAVIDFGDLCGGDPAGDLAAAWLSFTANGRSAFRDRLAGRYDDATWRRARGWAASFAGTALDAPEHGFGALGRHTRDQLAHR